QACASDCFISAWACHNSLLTTHYASAVTKPAKKFHIFHQRHHGKSANINKCSLPAEHSMIPASDSEQHACVMHESVREPINGVCWQVNAEIAAGDGPVIQYPRNFRYTFLRHFGIYVHEPKDVAGRRARPGSFAQRDCACSPQFHR